MLSFLAPPLKPPPRELACRITDKGSCPIHIGGDKCGNGTITLRGSHLYRKNGRLLIILIRDWSKGNLSLPCTLEMACSMLRFPLNQY